MRPFFLWFHADVGSMADLNEQQDQRPLRDVVKHTVVYGSGYVAMAIVRVVCTVTSAATTPTRRMSRNSGQRKLRPTQARRGGGPGSTVFGRVATSAKPKARHE